MRLACVRAIRFARIAASRLSQPEKTRPPASPWQPAPSGGFRTFSRLSYASETDDKEIDLAVLGIPFDSLVTFRPGARLGPGAIRQASGLCRNYSRQMEVAVFERLRAFDVGDVNVNPFNYEETFHQIEGRISKLQRQGAAVIALGGDHSVLLPILRATSKKYSQLTLIQFDSHTDTSDAGPSGQRFHHGTCVRRAIDEGLIAGNRIFQIGIRGFLETVSSTDYDKDAGIHILDMQGVHEPNRREAFLRTLRQTAGSGPCYLTFDVDSVDPAFAPGTGTPVVGGLTSFEALNMMRSFRGLRFIGGDVVEVAPAYDHSEITALLGAAIALEIGALIAIARGA